MKHQDPKKQTKGTSTHQSETPSAQQGSNHDPALTKPGVGKVGEQPDFGQGTVDFHQSNHGKRGR